MIDIAKSIKEAKNNILARSIKTKKVSKTLSLIREQIVELAESGISIEEQSEILSEALEMEIIYETYKSYYYRNIKPLLKKECKVVQKSEPKNKEKISKSGSLVDGLNRTFERKTKSKFEGMLK